MEDMTAKKIFRKIPMFDYQAICLEVDNNPSSAAFLWTVSDHSKSLSRFCLSLEFNLYADKLDGKLLAS